MAEAPICNQCSTPMHPQSIGTISGEDGILKVSVSDFPALVCERGHRHFIARDFPMKLLEKLAECDKTGLASSKKQGLLFKKYHCVKCGEPLGAEGEPRAFGFEVVGRRKRYYKDNDDDAILMTVEGLGPGYLAWLAARAEIPRKAGSPS